VAAVVDRDLVRRVAELARLRIDEADEAIVADELASIVRWIDVLGQLPDPPSDPLPAAAAPLRDDAVAECERAEDIVASFPEGQGDLLVVPAVLKDPP